MEEDYPFISLGQDSGSLVAWVVTHRKASEGRPEQEVSRREFSDDTIYLMIEVTEGAVCAFSFNADRRAFTELANSFQAAPGLRIGAKIGFFAPRDGVPIDTATADIDPVQSGTGQPTRGQGRPAVCRRSGGSARRGRGSPGDSRDGLCRPRADLLQ